MLQTALYTDIGGRSCNEDCVRQCSSGGDSLCLILADGLGGHGGGDRASDTVCRTLCEGFAGRVSPAVLIDLLNEAHRNIKALQTPQCSMKSTAVALTIGSGRAAWAHVGDSRLYHFLDGKLIFQTRDHSASQIAVMLGDITADQIRFHEDRNRVLRALGQDGALKVDAAEEFLSPGSHAYLLCSDGFWEYVLEHEMEEDLHLASDPEDWLRRMRERLAARIPPDNDNNTAAAVWLTR